MRLPLQSAGAKNPVSLMFRFHTQTAGMQLTAQKPEVNLVRVVVRGLAAVPGGSQSLHTNFYGEVTGSPTEKAARVALRTHEVLAFETDVTATFDPFAGSYIIESMTDEVEAKALELIEQVKARVVAVAAIEQGFQKMEIENTAYAIA
jgi:methylmalonyl-CoA mutase N-terminal domain/subunit